jgi:anti-sigma regulatory factor (Ser/Thr protein kinase)
MQQRGAMTPGDAAGLSHVRIDGLPVGLMLRVDEYLTTLGQELGMLRLDHRPSALPGRAAHSLDVVDRVLTEWSDARDFIRQLAEAAYDAGDDTFGVELDLPVGAAEAASALASALREIQEVSRQGKVLLPPLAEDAAAFFSAFLTDVVEQVRGARAGGELDPDVPHAPVHATLVDRRPARYSTEPTSELGQRRAAVSLGRDLKSAHEARRFAVRTLESWGLGDEARRAELPLAELVSNALLHSAGPVLVAIVDTGDTVRLEVHDTAPGRPAIRRRGSEADSGRGLILVDALADRWGCDSESQLRKRVWLEIDHGATG